MGQTVQVSIINVSAVKWENSKQQQTTLYIRTHQMPDYFVQHMISAAKQESNKKQQQMTLYIHD